MMSEVIWKFTLSVTDRQVVSMPAGAELLSVKMQHGVLCIWALGDPGNQCEDRVFEVYGTEDPVCCGMGFDRVFIDTVLDGEFVWHVFERTD